jgi:gamma-glutamyl-gamma-aminobutyrate hydrolase PuuD
MMETLDGFVLAGGGDIDADQYNEEAHCANRGVRAARDAFELAVIRAALDRDLPILGVCRGMQLLNVALGGSLIQHLPDVVGHHRHRPRLGISGRVQVRLAAGSRLGTILGVDLEVFCQHHQAVGRVADGLDIVGWAEDSTVEAVELPGRTFVLGVQWHPEQDHADGRLFTALITAAAAKRKGGVIGGGWRR